MIVSHAHRDHVAGARYLQERFGARVILSEADWNLLETDAGGWPKAKRDMMATDGQTLTLGDTTLTFYMTPGHTLGTISTIIPLKGTVKLAFVERAGTRDRDLSSSQAAIVTASQMRKERPRSSR